MTVLDVIERIVEYRKRHQIAPPCVLRPDFLLFPELDQDAVDSDLQDLMDMGVIIEKDTINSKSYYLHEDKDWNKTALDSIAKERDRKAAIKGRKANTSRRSK